MKLLTTLPAFRQDIADVMRLFLGDVKITDDPGEEGLVHESFDADGWHDRVTFRGVTRDFAWEKGGKGELEEKRLRKRAAKLAVYSVLKEALGFRPPWGSLTGIRPTRLFYEALAQGMTEDEAERFMAEEYDVSESKASLLRDIVRMQKGVHETGEGEFDLYIGIPFGATRCAYCSFSSGEIGDGRLVEPYIASLLREIKLTRALMEEANLKIRAAYMGGGTPTAISESQLSRILDAAQAAFPGAVEWTVEAGRPDTIDRGKLSAMREHGITRISVNPQTFSDETLRAIGRAHTAEDTVRAFELARSEGFNHINMDIIAALPGETQADFDRTLSKVISMDPESVTVHALAIKHSSKLHESLHVSGKGHTQISAEGADHMISGARERLMAGGWRPYYLYRQKYMAGNLENVGYAKPGHACLYNIGNMEETACVLALGAGSISKWLFRDRDLRLERAPNVKNIEEYTRRVDEMVARTRRLILGEGEQA